MVKWFFKVVFSDGSFALESFEAKDKFAAYAKLQAKYKKFKTVNVLTEKEFTRLKNHNKNRI